MKELYYFIPTFMVINAAVNHLKKKSSFMNSINIIIQVTFCCKAVITNWAFMWLLSFLQLMLQCKALVTNGAFRYVISFLHEPNSYEFASWYLLHSCIHKLSIYVALFFHELHWYALSIDFFCTIIITNQTFMELLSFMNCFVVL